MEKIKKLEEEKRKYDEMEEQQRIKEQEARERREQQIRDDKEKQKELEAKQQAIKLKEAELKKEREEKERKDREAKEKRDNEERDRLTKQKEQNKSIPAKVVVKKDNTPLQATGKEIHKAQGNLMGTEEDDEEESEENESEPFEGQFNHTGKPTTTTPAITVTKRFDESKQPVQTKVQDKPQIDNILKTETFQSIENNNELEIAVNNSYWSSEFDDEEAEENEEDEEDDIKELLEIIHQVESSIKLNLANNLFGFIDANWKTEKTSYQDLFKSEDILNFDVNTTKLFQLMLEASSNRNNKAAMNCKNWSRLLMAILLSDKKKNFEGFTFAREYRESSRNDDDKLFIDSIVKYMKKPTCK